MESGKIHNKPGLKLRRKKLRRTLTPAEAFLWKHLQNGKLKGRKFRRQHSAGIYVLDFYCPAEKLAVELDGAYYFNDESALYDEKRTRYLNSLGREVLRFENIRIFEDTKAVLEETISRFKNSPR